MIPKKSKLLVSPIAEATGVSKDLVQDLTTFFWKEVRLSLTELRGPHINVEGLGVFNIKHWKLPEVVKNYEDTLARYKGVEKVSFAKFHMQKEYEVRLETVQNVMKLIEEDKLKKQAIKDKRNDKSTDIRTDNLEK